MADRQGGERAAAGPRLPAPRCCTLSSPSPGPPTPGPWGSLCAEAGSSGGRGGIATGNPLLDALQALQRGLGLAAIKIGEAFLNLGHFLRGVGENLSRAL